MDFSKLTAALERKGYTVREFADRNAARSYLDACIDGGTVGIGGSHTVHEMGLYESLRTHNTVYWHDFPPEGMTIAETRRAACGAEVYISSVNGIAETGEIVNIDGTGNRVAAISYGPKRIFLLVGQNKIAPDFEAAMKRARNVAAPKNARRLQRKTPCAEHADRCYNCSSPERICRIFSVLREKPMGSEAEIILVHEDLGF